jgi:hypothetical protein
MNCVEDICDLNRIMRLPKYEDLNFDVGFDNNRMLDGKSLACCMILSAKTMYIQVIGDDALREEFVKDIKKYM